MLNRDDQLTLNLIYLEIISSVTSIIGLILFILASNVAKDMILSSNNGQRNFRPSLNPDITTLVARSFLVISGVIVVGTVTTRLIQRNQQVLRNEPIQGTLIPITYITLGSWISLFGALIAIVGDYKRVQETPSSIPIY